MLCLCGFELYSRWVPLTFCGLWNESLSEDNEKFYSTS